MRAVVQRVSEARVEVEGETVAVIGDGLLVLIGVGPTDTERDAEVLASKLTSMRIFSDEGGKMNLSIRDSGGSVLIVSQFTLLADVRKGRRPSFTGAAHPDVAKPLIEHLAAGVSNGGVPVATGRFGAMMEVSLNNSGPVTFVIDVEDGNVK